MAHFAKVKNGIVTNVIVAEQEFIDNYVDGEVGEWIQTSYNTFGGIHYVPNTNFQTPSEDQTKALRKNYAGIGNLYDASRDAFYATQPHASWTLNETSCLWEAPTACPNDDKSYIWNETTLSWDLVE